VCFFSPLMHGLLTGKYMKPCTFKSGDFREGVDAFKNPVIIDKIKENANRLRERFSDHPNPVMRGVIDSLISDSQNSCVLLGQRNPSQVAVAKTLGESMSLEDVNWVKELYKQK